MPCHVYDPEHGSYAKRFLHTLPPARRVALERDPHAYVWGDTLPIIREADGFLINLETSITTNEQKRPKVYVLRPNTFAGVRYASLANNHVLDYEVGGMLQTLDALKEAGIHHAGAGPNAEAARKPAIFEVAGRKVGVISAADHPEEWAAGDRTPGTYIVDPEEAGAAEAVAAQVAELKRAVDLAVFSIHWGPNYRWQPLAAFRAFARAVIDAGADVFHGHSAHHIQAPRHAPARGGLRRPLTSSPRGQGLEVYKGRPIIYGSGDFLDDYAVDDQYRNDLSFLYELSFDGENRLAAFDLVPTRCNHFQVNVARGEDATWLLETAARLSSKLGARVDLAGAGGGGAAERAPEDWGGASVPRFSVAL
eukprot:tig00001264_g7885.t1